MITLSSGTSRSCAAAKREPQIADQKQLDEKREFSRPRFASPVLNPSEDISMGFAGRIRPVEDCARCAGNGWFLRLPILIGIVQKCNRSASEGRVVHGTTNFIAA